MRLLGSSEVVAAPTIHPYEQYRLSSMFRAAQVLCGLPETPRHGWGHHQLFPDVWEDCLKPVSYDDPDLVDKQGLFRNALQGLWSGFCKSVQETRAARDLAPAVYYAEKSEPRIAEALAREIECRLLFVIRDPRDVFLSSQHFNRKRRNFDYGWTKGTKASDLVRWQIDRVRADLDRFDQIQATGIATKLMRYEDMIGHPDRFARELGNWLDPKLDISVLAAEVSNHGDRHLTSPSIEESTARWRRELPAKLNRLHIELAGDLLDRFDYSR